MPDDILPGLYIRRLVHYLHTSYVVNNLLDNGKKDMFCGLMRAYHTKFIDDDDYHHLLTFKDIIDENSTVVKNGMDDAKALFALFAMAIYANVFDKRTYMPFIDDLSPEEREEQKAYDINAIPPLERRHYCYCRGLAFDLLSWFFNNYGFSKPGEEPDYAYRQLFAPYIAELGHSMVEYKLAAEQHEVPSTYTAEDFRSQVEMALFEYRDMEDLYKDIEEPNPSFAFDIDDYTLKAYESMQNIHESITEYFECGQTIADRKYFAAVGGQE